jgi:sensor histidine kinase YesM
MFERATYNLKHFSKMYNTCPQCNYRFEREPGFFFGAMYVSYALSVGLFLSSVFLLYYFAGDPTLTTYITTICVLSLVLYPVIFRYSRVIFVHLFSGVRYIPSRTPPNNVS